MRCTWLPLGMKCSSPSPPQMVVSSTQRRTTRGTMLRTLQRETKKRVSYHGTVKSGPEGCQRNTYINTHITPKTTGPCLPVIRGENCRFGFPRRRGREGYSFLFGGGGSHGEWNGQGTYIAGVASLSNGQSETVRKQSLQPLRRVTKGLSHLAVLFRAGIDVVPAPQRRVEFWKGNMLDSTRPA